MLGGGRRWVLGGRTMPLDETPPEVSHVHRIEVRSASSQSSISFVSCSSRSLPSTIVSWERVWGADTLRWELTVRVWIRLGASRSAAASSDLDTLLRAEVTVGQLTSSASPCPWDGWAPRAPFAFALPLPLALDAAWPLAVATVVSIGALAS